MIRLMDRRMALALGVLATATLLVAGRRQGFTRDEGYYFDAAEMYYAWYGDLGEALLAGKPGRVLSRAAVDRAFGYNHEHPALMKTLYGVSWRFLHRCKCLSHVGHHPVAYPKPHRTLGLLSDAEALRFPANLFGGILVALAYLFGVRAWSRRAGLVAALLTLFTPRLFFHAELACFDAPVATTWLLTVYCYWRSLTDRRWAFGAGLAFGLALATKHNGFFLPFVLAVHWLWVERARIFRGRLPTLPRAFLWMALLGPAIEIAHWPWLWFDTVARLREYFAFHLHHVYYNMEYLGANYNKPPFPKSFPFIMTLLTAPVTMLGLALGGGLALLRRRPNATGPAGAPGFLVAANAIFPMAIISLTGAPIFGATKHWLAAIPFMALLAGFAIDGLSRTLVARPSLGGRRATAVAGMLVALAIAPALAETWRSHPYGLSHYNLLAGGPAGGADLGMNRQFWGYSTRGVLPWLNKNAPPRAQVYWHDTNGAILNMNVREGLMRDDLFDTGLEEPGVKRSDLALVIHEKHFNKYEYWIWDFYGTSRPALVLTDEGVPIVTLYRRPKP